MSKFPQNFTLLLVVAIAFLTGCTGASIKSDQVGQSPAVVAGGTSQKSSASPTDLSDTGADLQAIPLAVNRQVLRWIDYFQGQGRPHMERYLSRSTRYMPVMKEIFKKEGLPEDLIYIALIESGFSSAAKSTASAVGYWQFIRGTGRRYGLRIDTYIDERRDFIKSTQAAAGFFKVLYDMFGVWYLAIASYNVGEGRVQKVISKYHTRDFWQLARENKLPEETSQYVPKFIAARLIAKNPEKYGFTDIDYLPPLDFAEVEFHSSVDFKKLAAQLNIDADDLHDLNPAYKRGVALLGKGRNSGPLVLRVPRGTETQALAAAVAAAPDANAKYATDDDFSFYRVRRGDSIATIARKFATTQNAIRRLNHFGAGSKLIAGKRIRVPAETVGGTSKQIMNSGTSVSASVSERSTRSRAQLTAGQVDRQERWLPPKRYYSAPTTTVARLPLRQQLHRQLHVVKRGETLIAIARKYHVSLLRLAEVNHITHRTEVRVGSQLRIPAATSSTAARF